MAFLLGGGGGGGARSGSGSVAGDVKFPAYLETAHGNWLDNAGADTLTASATDHVQTLVTGANPYNTFGAYTAPTTLLAAIQTRYNTYENVIDVSSSDVHWVSYTENARNQIDVDNTNLIPNLTFTMATVLTSIQTAITQAFADFDTHLSEMDEDFETQWGSIVSSAQVKADAVNILNSIDISTFLAAIRTGSDAEVAAAVAALVHQPDERIEWEEYLDNLKTEIGAGGVLDTVTPQFATAVTGADSEVAAGMIAIDDRVIPETDYDTYIEKVKAKLAVVGMLTAITPDFAGAITTANSELVAAIAAINPSTNPAVDYAAYSVQAKTSRDVTGHITAVVFATLLTAAQATAAAEVTSAIVAAQEAIDSDVLDALVLSVSNAMASDRAARRRRYAGGMADINAVHSSAFLIGLALIDSEEGRSIEEVVAKASVDIYSSALQLRPNILSSILTANIGTDLANEAANNEFMQKGILAMAGLAQQKATLEGIQTSLHAQIYSSDVGADLQADLTEETTRRGLLNTGVAQQAQLAGTRITSENAQIGLHGNTYNSHLNADLQADIIEANIRARFITDADGQQVDLYKANLGHEIAQLGLHGSAYTADLSARSQQEITNKTARDTLIRDGVVTMAEMLQTVATAKASFMSAYNNSVGTHIKQGMDEGRINKIARQAFLSEGIGIIHDFNKELYNHTSNSVRILQNIKQDNINIVRDVEAMDLEIDVRDEFWEIDALLTGAAIFGVVSGSHYVPRGPNRSASQAGGLLQGAAMGAVAGGTIGGPIGGAIGAGIGGLIGLFSGG